MSMGGQDYYLVKNSDSTSTLSFAGNSIIDGSPYYWWTPYWPYNPYPYSPAPYNPVPYSPPFTVPNSGWVCPKCGASNAPHVNQCPCTTVKYTWTSNGYSISSGDSLEETSVIFKDSNGNSLTIQNVGTE
jgi:hypothetical protein